MNENFESKKKEISQTNEKLTLKSQSATVVCRRIVAP